MKSMSRLGLLLAIVGLMQASTSASEGIEDPRIRAAALTAGVGFVLLASLFAGRLFAAMGLPKLTGYLSAGMIAGPAVLGLLPSATVSGMALVQGVAVALIALTAGSEMDFRAMKPLLRTIAWIVVIAVMGTAVLLAGLTFASRSLLGFLAEMPVTDALAVSAVIGVVVVAQSPAVVVAIRAETGADGPVARTVLGVVVLADLVVIALFAIVSSVCQAVLAGGVDVAEEAAGVSWELIGSLGIGTVIGGILALWMRVIGDRGLDLFVLATCLMVAEITQRFHLDALLVMLAAGLFVENVARAGHRLRLAFEDAALPVYILFFTVAGASIHLDVLPLVAVPAGILIIGRAAGLWSGTAVAAKLSGAPPEVQRWAGFGLMPQAGLAIALSLLLARTFPTFGEEASALTLGIVAVNELIAPVLMRWSLVRAGESKGSASTSDPHGETRASQPADPKAAPGPEAAPEGAPEA
jgi:Kef-type K+ transport system membrane component KefB